MEHIREVVGTIRPMAGVVLAAGESNRMGRAKLLLPLAGDSILGRTLANAIAGGISPLSVVGGAYFAQVAKVAKAKGLPCLLNQDYALGQSTSLIVGLQAAPPGYGVMYILGDAPFVAPASYAALAAAYGQSDALIVAPQGPDGRRGNPVIFAPQLFAEISLLSGDVGARGLLEKYRRETLLLPLDDAGLWLDIDTQQEYERYGG